MKEIDFWTNFLANIFTIAVSITALYVFFFNKEKISSAINFILSYSNQLSLTELKFKIERLNDYNTGDVSQKAEVINILHDIEGQILGNKKLKKELHEQLGKLANYTSNPKILTEPKKRSLVSELKESVRNIDVSSYNEIFDTKKEHKS
ncbi:hypothetical protein [Cytophaga aurantiaca]|uniref:hypothetical protein n=1 Tax=Cytophaga aurantiaca TaxID=29530 RepID=UPI000381F8CA|nr:hypothetical protein [Cytophaga aurantiaca]